MHAGFGAGNSYRVRVCFFHIMAMPKTTVPNSRIGAGSGTGVESPPTKPPCVIGVLKVSLLEQSRAAVTLLLLHPHAMAKVPYGTPPTSFVSRATSIRSPTLKPAVASENT